MAKSCVRTLIAVGLAVLIGACSSAPSANTSRNDYLTAGTLWFQTSGEARALMHQVYGLARRTLDADLKVKRKKTELKPAIVVDVDETVLDNSPFQGRAIMTGESYPKGWDEWIKLARAKPIAGAVDFLTYAHGKGVRIFYVTNRKDAQKADTAKNLKEMGFPDVSEETVIGRSAESSKEARRQKIREKHRIVFLMGDNLNDFATNYEQKSVADRLKAVDETKDKFGTEFLVIPNPMYGDWEAALYQYNFNRPAAELEKLRRDNLTSF